jgi:hypothetical protein
VTNENLRRKLDGLPPVKAMTDIPANEQPDAILAEATHIAIDLREWNKEYVAKLRADTRATSARPALTN